MHEIRRVTNFLENLPLKHKIKKSPVYRGQAQDYPLVPSLFRMSQPNQPDFNQAFHERYSWFELEEVLLDTFKKRALPLVRQEPRSDFEWLILGQHYGLPTRCLDWTDNPLAALFFAVEDAENEKDGVVWSLIPFGSKITYGKSYTLDEGWRRNSRNSIVLYYPPHFSPRMTAQQACITVHSLPEDREEFNPLEKSLGLDTELWKYIIPAESKESLKNELESIGMTYYTLYPDLEGISKSIVRFVQLKVLHGDMFS